MRITPVCREEAWRTAICIELRLSLTVQQFDVEGAFLNGQIMEELYVKDKRATKDRA